MMNNTTKRHQHDVRPHSAAERRQAARDRRRKRLEATARARKFARLVEASR